MVLYLPTLRDPFVQRDMRIAKTGENEQQGAHRKTEQQFLILRRKSLKKNVLGLSARSAKKVPKKSKKSRKSARERLFRDFFDFFGTFLALFWHFFGTFLALFWHSGPVGPERPF